MNVFLFDVRKESYEVDRHSKEYTHILKILRLSVGSRVRIATKDGYVGTGTIKMIDASRIEFSAQWHEQVSGQRLPIEVLLGHPRPIVTKRLIKDLTTIGVARLHVVQADLSEKSYRDSKIWRPEAIRSYLEEGTIQAGTPGDMEVSRYDSLDSFFATRAKMHQENAGLVYASIVNTIVDSTPSMIPEEICPPVLVCIGPERGWSDREEALLKRHATTNLSFGNRILRTETACTGAVLFIAQRIQLP